MKPVNLPVPYVPPELAVEAGCFAAFVALICFVLVTVLFASVLVRSPRPFTAFAFLFCAAAAGFLYEDVLSWPHLPLFGLVLSALALLAEVIGRGLWHKHGITALAALGLCVGYYCYFVVVANASRWDHPHGIRWWIDRAAATPAGFAMTLTDLPVPSVPPVVALIAGLIAAQLSLALMCILLTNLTIQAPRPSTAFPFLACSAAAVCITCGGLAERHGLHALLGLWLLGVALLAEVASRGLWRHHLITSLTAFGICGCYTCLLAALAASAKFPDRW
jgi:hypothetical protein